MNGEVDHILLITSFDSLAQKVSRLLFKERRSFTWICDTQAAIVEIEKRRFSAVIILTSLDKTQADFSIVDVVKRVDKTTQVIAITDPKWNSDDDGMGRIRAMIKGVLFVVNMDKWGFKQLEDHIEMALGLNRFMRSERDSSTDSPPEGLK